MNARELLFRLRRYRAGIGAALLTVAALLAWPLAPLRADVIDNFEHGRKFMVWGAGDQPEWEFIGGEFKLLLPTPHSWVTFFYDANGVYELAEGQPVEFRLDAISSNCSDAYVCLLAGFANEGDDRAYACYVMRNRVLLCKQYGGAYPYFFDQSVAENVDPKTISLTLTREGNNMKIGLKVVLRDDPQQVLFSREVVDTPGVDPMVEGQDPGPPPAGPVITAAWNCGAMNNYNAEFVVDNLVCSKDQSPVGLSIRQKNASEAALAWTGVRVVLESDSVQGLWRPCPERVLPDVGGYTTSVGLSGLSRYFRVVGGRDRFDSFDKPGRWQTASVVPGSKLKPSVYIDAQHSRARILGAGTFNEDFMLRSNVGIWFRDCVGTVDIIDWGDAMEGAAFGVLLRARPEQALWFANIAGLPEERYAGLLTFKKPDNPAESALTITGPGGEVLKEQRFPAVNPDKQYRLRFWAVGDQLTLELFDRDNLSTSFQSITATDGRIPEGMDGLYGTKSAGGTYEVWIDQYMLNGSTVY